MIDADVPEAYVASESTKSSAVREELTACTLYLVQWPGQTTLPRARLDPLWGYGALSLILSSFAGVLIARSGSVSSMPLLALLTAAGALILLSLRPVTLVLGWLALAPLLQESAGATTIGHTLTLGLYLAPPLVLIIWTLTRKGERPPLGFIDALPILYLGYVAGSFVFAGADPSTWVKRVYATVALGIILYFFLAFGPSATLSWASISGVLLLASTVQAIMSIIENFTGWNLWNYDEQYGRSVATLSSPANLGAFIGVGIVLAVSILVWKGPAYLQLLSVVTILIGLPGLFFTYTRGPIIGTAVAIIVILAVCARTRLLAVISLIVATAVVTASWSSIEATTAYQERFSNRTNVEARVLLQDWSLTLAEKRPLFGWGYGSFDEVKNSAGLTSEDIPEIYALASTSHNTFLTILVESGAFGVITLFLPWIIIMHRGLRSAITEPQNRWFLVGSLAALFVIVFVANTSDLRFFSFIPALPWLFLGLLRRHQLARR